MPAPVALYLVEAISVWGARGARRAFAGLGVKEMGGVLGALHRRVGTAGHRHEASGVPAAAAARASAAPAACRDSLALPIRWR